MQASVEERAAPPRRTVSRRAGRALEVDRRADRPEHRPNNVVWQRVPPNLKKLQVVGLAKYLKKALTGSSKVRPLRFLAMFGSPALKTAQNRCSGHISRSPVAGAHSPPPPLRAGEVVQAELGVQGDQGEEIDRCSHRGEMRRDPLLAG
jgi:hypothetical protein